MLIYSKTKYMALSKYYDAIESGEGQVFAAEQAIGCAELSDEWEQMIFCFTMVEKLLLLNIPLSQYLIDKTHAAIKMFQSMSENILQEQIPVPMYLTNMSREYQRIYALMEEKYDFAE